jgi:hypothetical protein
MQPPKFVVLPDDSSHSLAKSEDRKGLLSMSVTGLVHTIQSWLYTHFISTAASADYGACAPPSSFVAAAATAAVALGQPHCQGSAMLQS